MKGRILHAPSRMVCRASYIHEGLFLRAPDFGAALEVAEPLKCWFRLPRLEAVSIAQYQGRIQHSVDKSSRGVHHAL